MENSRFTISFIWALLVSLSWPSSSYSSDQAFIQCLENYSNPSNPISAVLYSPQNSSYSSVLQNYINNLRFNESSTPKPRFILTALHVSHIQAAIICAKAHGLQMKIRSGGHDFEGLSYWSNIPNFFILDMFNLRSINVSIQDESAWVEAGATLGEVYYRIAEKSSVHGFPAGVCPRVGVGGHFSGGGYGNMMRRCGLSVDNIIDAQLIDVNGRLLDRKSMGEDLFWAITGGGGSSFGVVLSYKIKLVRVPPQVTVFRVTRTYDENFTNLFYRYLQVAADKLPRELFIRVNLDVVNGKNRASFVALFLGSSRELLSLMNDSFPELGLQQTDCLEMSWIESVLFWTNFPTGTPVNALLGRIPPSITYLHCSLASLRPPSTVIEITNHYGFNMSSPILLLLLLLYSLSSYPFAALNPICIALHRHRAALHLLRSPESGHRRRAASGISTLTPKRSPRRARSNAINRFVIRRVVRRKSTKNAAASLFTTVRRRLRWRRSAGPIVSNFMSKCSSFHGLSIGMSRFKIQRFDLCKSKLKV